MYISLPIKDLQSRTVCAPVVAPEFVTLLADDNKSGHIRVEWISHTPWSDSALVSLVYRR